MDQVRRGSCLAVTSLVCGSLLIGGCGIVGTWECVRCTGPEGAMPAAPARVVFRDDDTYSATVTYDDQETTNRGRYTWNGWRLTVTPRNRRARNYRGFHLWNTLWLSTEYQGETVRCRLKRVQRADH